IIIVGFAVYSNSLKGKFIWDDRILIENNTYIRSWSNILKLFKEDIGRGAGRRYDFYHPVQMLTYMVDYSLWKLDERGYHLTNIILHISVALSIYWVITLLFSNRLLSFLTSLFFVVHPIHSEAVAYISDRGNSMAALFMLLSFAFYLKQFHSERKSLYIPLLLTYVLALLSKENSLIFPALVLLYHYTFKNKVRVGLFMPLVGVACIYVVLRSTLLKSSTLQLPWFNTAFQRVPGFFVAITNYLRLMILPFHLHMDYGRNLFKLTDIRAIFGVVILCALLICAFRERKSNRLITFSILWFFVALLPFSNIFPLPFYMAERYLYLPSIGFFLILSIGMSLMCRAKKFRAYGVILIVSLLSSYSYLTIRQLDYWKEPIAFYQRTLKYTQESPAAQNNLGLLYYKAGKIDKAMQLFMRAITINPYYVEAYNNLGLVYRSTGRMEEAIIMFKKVIEINPGYPQVYNNLGLVYRSIGKVEEAIVMFKRAIEINPDYADAYNNLATVYMENPERREEAIVMFKRAIEINPDYADNYYNNLGVLYRNMERYQEAIASFEKAVEINPDYTEAYYNLANLYSDIGKNEEAISSFIKAVQSDPNCAEAYNKLGFIYSSVGDIEQAIVLYKRAIEIDPDFAVAHNNLAEAYYYLKQYNSAVKHWGRAIELGFEVKREILEFIKTYRN
ncbi:MAG TPA: tetratricopeptide repeat protein, partial [Candidatus Omnitrophica bacterium]|nr:tetratricopeptide repeat protein [Candidatus Omnitrophota bacterium]